MVIRSINPFNSKTISEYTEMTPEEVDTIILETHKAFLHWRSTTFDYRAERLSKMSTILIKEKQNYATLITREMGKPITESKSEIEKCAWVCQYYADNGQRFLQDEIIITEFSQSFVTFQPLGVIVAIMPWNFPFWQVLRFAAAAITAGNTIVLKHASNIPGCALELENLFSKAGFPSHTFRTLLTTSNSMESIIENRFVRGVTLTGSVEAGKAVARKAGEMLKKTVLELGGNDAYIIMNNADVEIAACTCARSRLINSGQSCIGAKRFVVVKSQKKRFEELLTKHMKEATMGDPTDERTTVGPLARRDLRDNLHGQVQQSINQGARCLLGGFIPEGPGAFYPPTVLTDVKRGMAAYHEEMFGPVAAVIPVKDDVEAIAMANDSQFGLGAALFTTDIEKGRKIAINELEAGNCFINDFVQSDPRLPFGGIKESGYGRELSHYGIKEFVNIKTIVIK